MKLNNMKNLKQHLQESLRIGINDHPYKNIMDKISDIVCYYDLNNEDMEIVKNILQLIEIELDHNADILPSMSPNKLKDMVIDDFKNKYLEMLGVSEKDPHLAPDKVEKKISSNKLFNKILNNINNDSIIVNRNDHNDDIEEGDDDTHINIFNNYIWNATGKNEYQCTEIYDEDIYNDLNWLEKNPTSPHGDLSIQYANFYDKIFIINISGDDIWYSEEIWIIINK